MTNKIRLKKKENIFNNVFLKILNSFLLITKKVLFFICSFIFHLGILCLSIKYHFCFQWLLVYGLILMITIISLTLLGIYRSERLPIDDEEANKLDIHNIKEYIDFIYNYMKIKNSIILRILLFMDEVDLTLYLTDKHFQYMESLIKKEYGNDIIIKFSNNEYCFCEFCNNLTIDKVFTLCFNNKQVKNIGNVKFCDYSICDLPLWKI